MLEPLRVSRAVVVPAAAGLYVFAGGCPQSQHVLHERYARQVSGSSDPAEQWHNRVVRLRDSGVAVGYVQATVHPDHVASQRVAAALGMTQTDRLVDGEGEWELVVRAADPGR